MAGDDNTTGVRTPLKRSKYFVCVTKRTQLRSHGMERWRGQALFVAGGGDRDRRAGRERRGGEGQAQGGDHPQQGRDPDDPGRQLQGHRLRLRLRVRRGQHLHDGRVLRDLQRASARSTSAPTASRPEGYTNLESDLFYQRIKDRGIIDELLAAAAAGRAEAEGPPGGRRATSPATTATCDKTGVANLPDPTCAGAPWVREITIDDAYRRFYQLGQLAVGPDRRGRDRQRRAARRGELERGATPTVTPADVAELGEALDAQRGDTGSNGWGIGSDATENGSGMVLGNPHFPWQGSERFYQSHLVVPGKVNVSGASLFGVPVINIGHTDNLAWTHTVSTAFRFVPIAAHAGARRPDQLPGRRPAGEDGDQRRHGPGPAARRLARAGDPDALHDPLRADHHLAPGPGALRLDEHDGLRDVRRERGEPPLPQPLLRHQPAPSRPTSCSTS